MMRRKQDPTNPIGLAFAGHAFRTKGNEKKASQYENPLTDLVSLIIAEVKACDAGRYTSSEVKS